MLFEKTRGHLLSWAFSVFAGISAWVGLWVLTGKPIFVAQIGWSLGAIIVAKLSGWIASRSGRSEWGWEAAILTWLIYAGIITLAAVVGAAVLPNPIHPTPGTAKYGLGLFGAALVLFVTTSVIVLPIALLGTAAFHIAIRLAGLKELPYRDNL
jgi:hypothetical protein